MHLIQQNISDFLIKYTFRNLQFSENSFLSLPQLNFVADYDKMLIIIFLHTRKNDAMWELFFARIEWQTKIILPRTWAFRKSFVGKKNSGYLVTFFWKTRQSRVCLCVLYVIHWCGYWFISPQFLCNSSVQRKNIELASERVNEPNIKRRCLKI